MSDVFDVKVTLDKASYNAGDLITATLSGNDVQTVTTTATLTVGPLTGSVVAADGATSPVTIPAFPVVTTSSVATPQSVTFDKTVPIVDPSGRVWTFVDGLTLTAKA